VLERISYSLSAELSGFLLLFDAERLEGIRYSTTVLLEEPRHSTVRPFEAPRTQEKTLTAASIYGDGPLLNSNSHEVSSRAYHMIEVTTTTFRHMRYLCTFLSFEFCRRNLAAMTIQMGKRFPHKKADL
jgi:hypothetical protein